MDLCEELIGNLCPSIQSVSLPHTVLQQMSGSTQKRPTPTNGKFFSALHLWILEQGTQDHIYKKFAELFALRECVYILSKGNVIVKIKVTRLFFFPGQMVFIYRNGVIQEKKNLMVNR